MATQMIVLFILVAVLVALVATFVVVRVQTWWTREYPVNLYQPIDLIPHLRRQLWRAEMQHEIAPSRKTARTLRQAQELLATVEARCKDDLGCLSIVHYNPVTRELHF